MVIKHVVFFTINKSKRYLLSCVYLSLYILGGICLWQIMKKNMWLQQDTNFFPPLFNLVIIMTSSHYYSYKLQTYTEILFHFIRVFLHMEWSLKLIGALHLEVRWGYKVESTKELVITSVTRHILITVQRALHAAEA